MTLHTWTILLGSPFHVMTLSLIFLSPSVNILGLMKVPSWKLHHVIIIIITIIIIIIIFIIIICSFEEPTYPVPSLGHILMATVIGYCQ